MVYRDEMGRFISPEGIDTPEKETQKGYVPIDEVPDPNGKTPEDLLIEAEEEQAVDKKENDDEGDDILSDEDSEEPTLYDLQQKGEMTSTGDFEGNTDDAEYKPVGSVKKESLRPHLSEVGVHIRADEKVMKREEVFPKTVRRDESVRSGRSLRKKGEEAMLDNNGKEYTEPTIGERDDREMGKIRKKIQEENDWRAQIKEVEPSSEYDTDDYALPKQEPVAPPKARTVEYARDERTGFGKAQSRPKGPTRFWKRLMGGFRKGRKNIADKRHDSSSS
ncbi:MAG: hypothetical protein V1848_02640 [Candidatus Magasanikbacteria bacterium]